ncbi:MAG TPA: glycosyltransferase family 2 protein [Defluviicoccus sp.]|nr:glycosyltransferase family 2 protein [Defluviicoccus sp.]
MKQTPSATAPGRSAIRPPGSDANGALPLSCFIIAQNEADRIARTIASVADLAREIIVIDSGSTDDTVAIAEAAGARVIYNPWPGFGQQKRFGEQQCHDDWLLNLDADEVVSSELASDIRALFAGGATPALAVYGMRVSIVYPGWTKPRPFARDHYCLRLYDRRRCRFKDSTLFDSVDPGQETVGALPGVLYHHSVRSLADLARKADARATYNALHSKPKSTPVLLARAAIELPWNLFKYVFLRTHILGGWTGLRYAWITAYYRWQRIVRMLRSNLRGSAH